MPHHIKLFILYLVFFLLFLGILFLLPFIGASSRAIEVRVRTFFYNILHSQELGRINEELRKEQRELISQLITLRETEEENAFLRERLGLGEEDDTNHLLLAEIIGEGSVFGTETLVINRGTHDGLRGDEVVIISPNTLVGRVEELFSNRAIIRLLFDTEFRIPALLSSGVKGVVHGEVGKKVFLDEVSQASALQEGDTVVTDNNDEAVPSKILIGRIKTITSMPTDIFQRAELDIFFTPSRLEQVFVIIE